MIHDALQRCVCCNFGFLVDAAKLFLLLVQVFRLPVWISAFLGLTDSPIMAYAMKLSVQGMIRAAGRQREECKLRIVMGEERAVRGARYFRSAQVKVIVKCSGDAADTFRIGGQDVRCLHFCVKNWSSYEQNLASIAKICVETWAIGYGVFFYCADGETDAPAGVAAILSEATRLSPFYYLNIMPKMEIKTWQCERQEDVLIYLERVRQGLHRRSSQSSQGDAMSAVAVAVSPGVRTDIPAVGANQSSNAVRYKVPEQCVNEIEVTEREGEGFTHTADSPAAAREEPAPCRPGLIANACRYFDVRILNPETKPSFVGSCTADSPAAAREEPAPCRHGLMAKPCRYTDVRKMNHETKPSSPAAVTPAADLSSSRTNRWTRGSTWLAARSSNSAWQVNSGTHGGAWAAVGGGGGRGWGFKCYTCGGLGHKSDICPTAWH